MLNPEHLVLLVDTFAVAIVAYVEVAAIEAFPARANDVTSVL